MKASQKIAVWASIINVIAVILGIALYNPLSGIIVGGMPVMIYALVLIAVATIVAGYAVIPKIEAREERGD